MKAKRKPHSNLVAQNDGLDWLSEYFRKQRFSATNHLGLGDIRLTIGQQEHILKRLKQSNRRFNRRAHGGKMKHADEASPVQGDVMRVVCPTCNRETKVTWNGVHGQDNRWYHECWECDNVFETVGRVHEDAHNG